MDQLAQKTANSSGPFETWRNPVTGEESQFVTFPVKDYRIAEEVTLATEEHGQYMEWTFSLSNLPQTLPETLVMRRQSGERVGGGGTAVGFSPQVFVGLYVLLGLTAVFAIVKWLV